MDALTVFGATPVAAMLVFYALETRSAWFVLAFAGACLASSAYGFLQGAWPSASSSGSGRESPSAAGDDA